MIFVAGHGAEDWLLGCCVPALTWKCGCSWKQSRSWWYIPRIQESTFKVIQFSLKFWVVWAAALQGQDVPSRVRSGSGGAGTHTDVQECTDLVPKHQWPFFSPLPHDDVETHQCRGVCLFNTGLFPPEYWCVHSFFPKKTGIEQDSPKAHSKL